MSHEIETAMFVKHEAWHRLGKLLMEAPSTIEAFKASGLDWQVALRALVMPTAAGMA